MLDSDTKRRIDSARDILVGKVPDPKSQVEQITIALIYKFMDDMDAQAEDLGGKRSFFSGDYARFRWPKLVRGGLGGHETLNLYAEAIATMPKNPGIPALFRDIFKNAFLPYRDPETLRSFLKIIDEFTYDHSERLGDAFEYLLSVLGSQGDAGQFRTPRHIIDFMVRIVDPKKTDTILDPACGTAGFLISAYKHIEAANTKDGHTALTPDERKRLADAMRGYDISPDMVRLSLVNMYLHGFTDPHIYEYDTLTQQERWNETADVILANPPFMSPKGGIKPHNRFSVPSKRSEVLFVDYMAEHLTPGGRAGIIVPEGIIFQSQTAYTKLRKMLIEEFLIGVISLPSGVFQPYTSVKTSILILDRSEAKRNPNIMFSDVRHIGFSLGVKRTVTTHNDLPYIESDYHAYYRGRELSRHSWFASRESILANGCNLSGGRYKPKLKVGNTEMVPVSQLLTPVEREETLEPGREYRFLGVKWYAKGLFIKDKIRGSDIKATKAYRVETGDFVYNRLFAWKGSFALADESVHGCHVSNEFPCFRIDESRVDPRFLIFLFSAQRLWSESFENSSGASVTSRNRLKENELLAFEIPLPPLEVQKEIVAEIEAYQKVIDGARAVLDHYRPHIPINPEWPMVRLDDISAIQGGVQKSRDRRPDVHHRPYLTVRNVQRGFLDLSEVDRFEVSESELARLRLQRGDVLIVEGNGSPDQIGRCALFDIETEEWVHQNHVIRVRIDRVKAIPHFISLFLNSEPGRDQMLIEAATTSGLYTLSVGKVGSLKVPLPPLAEQEKIVAEIEAEQRLVEANRQLIERMEQKIAATLARIWGEDKQPAAAAAHPEEITSGTA